MAGTLSAVNILFNDFGEMPNSYSTVAVPMRFCATIWEGSTVKIKFEARNSKLETNPNVQNPKDLSCLF